MDTLVKWIALPLGYIMEVCYRFIGNYGITIIFFTFLTKIILIPVSVWVQKNSIKMVKMQPALNRIKAKYYGDNDTIADEQSKLYKENKYNPLASLIPLAIQIILLMGVVGVIYNPFDYLFHLPSDLIASINQIASKLTGVPVVSSSIQLSAIEAIKNTANNELFLALKDQYPLLDVSGIINNIQNFKLSFLGMDLSWNPSLMMGITILVPVVAGFSSWLLCVAQNKSNVLQAEQSKFNKYSMLILSVGLSLYLGFFVPAGIALYWVASNLFAILQLYILNAIIPPKKYVDYKALEESRAELAELDGLEQKHKLFSKDENYKREKTDYKRFFSIANKHLVIYSERSGFYKYYEALINYLIKKTNITIHYVTNDPSDMIFELSDEQPRIKSYYIGVKKMITLMMKMDSDMVIMTTPDLDNYYVKRSLVRKDIEYVYVPHDSASIHMGFREHALDNFDTVFCVGPHMKNEIRATERVYGTKEKTLVEFGYPLIEKLSAAYEAMRDEPKEKKQILIAPSWQEDNLLDSCIEKLIDSLYGNENHIIVRPHPEYTKRYGAKMNTLVEKYTDKIGDKLSFELDFSTNTSIYSSDIIITDWSAIGLEFAFSTLKPVLYINTKMKIENNNYQNIGIIPQEIALRDKIGISLEKNELDKTFDTVKILLDSDYRSKIENIRNDYFYNYGSAGSQGGKYIIDRFVNKK